MDLATGGLFILIALLVLNSVAARLPLVRRAPILLSCLDGVSGGVALYLVFYGLPGFDHLPIVNVLFGLLLVIHVVAHMRLRAEWKRERQGESPASRRERAEEIAAALRRSEDDDARVEP